MRQNLRKYFAQMSKFWKKLHKTKMFLQKKNAWEFGHELNLDIYRKSILLLLSLVTVYGIAWLPMNAYNVIF